MKVLGEKTEVRVETSYKLAGIKCDVCGKIIEPPSIEDQYKWMEKPYTYYAVKTGHHDWGNDSIESIEERDICIDCIGKFVTVPFPVSWTVKMKKKQKETQDILSYHSQAAGCSDKARAKASGGRQPIEECGRTGL